MFQIKWLIEPLKINVSLGLARDRRAMAGLLTAHGEQRSLRPSRSSPGVSADRRIRSVAERQVFIVSSSQNVVLHS